MSSAKGTGWQPQPDDERDWIYPPPRNVSRKASVDLRKTLNLQPMAYHQGAMGSCTANAIASALRFGRNAEHAPVTDDTKRPYFNPSRLFIYWNENERLMDATGGEVLELEVLKSFLQNFESTTINGQNFLNVGSKKISLRKIRAAVKQDSGANIRNGMKSLTKYGRQPDTSAWKDSEFTYWRIRDMGETPEPGQRPVNVIGDLEAALSEGYPVIFAFWWMNSTNLEDVSAEDDYVFQGWTEDWTHVYSGDGKDKLFGGHAVLAVGYDQEAKQVLVLNSWGTGFGMEGYFYLPYSWFCSNCPVILPQGPDNWPRVDDLWVVKMRPVQELTEQPKKAKADSNTHTRTGSANNAMQSPIRSNL